MWTFNPILKSIIWGGEKIAPFKGIQTDLSTIGESLGDIRSGRLRVNRCGRT